MNDDLRADFLRYVAQTSAAPLGLRIERAQGAWLYAADGRRYLDFISGIGVANLGHGHPAIAAAIARQADRYLHVMVYGEYVLDAQVALARRLAALLPSAIEQVYFTNSGAEAIEGALKTARKLTGRAGFVAFDGAYHGDTMGAMALAGNPAFRVPFGPLPGPVHHLPYGDEAALAALDGNIAAAVIEPVQAEAGVRIPDVAFMRALRRRCDETGTLLIFDEVLTGFGRTGKLFAVEHFGITPDLVVLAKALGGGLPLGAFCGPASVLGVLAHDPPLGHITTFGGHPLSCAAGLASLEVIAGEDWPARGGVMGQMLKERLRALVGGAVVDVRGVGMLLGIEFAKPPLTGRFVMDCIEHGLIANWTLNAECVVRLAPPLNLTSDEAGFAIDVMTKAIRRL